MNMAMQETLGDLVGTAGDFNVTVMIQSMLEDIVLDRKIEANWLERIEAREAQGRKAWSQQVWPIFLARQKAYQAATTRSVAWLRDADGSLDDINKAAKLFNSKAVWSESVRHSDYERISALVEARSAS